MNDLTNFDPHTLGILAQTFRNRIVLPGIQEIFLFETQIAGTMFSDLDELEPSLSEGSSIKMIREANNNYDSLAILLQDDRGNKLGYVPRERNEVLARLMDAGKLTFGKLIEKEKINSWWKLTIQIFLKD